LPIEQIDGNIRFFKNDVTAAFAEVTDAALRAEFSQTNGAVMAALGAYKKFLQKELLPKSNGKLRTWSGDVAKALSANEMIGVPLDELLKIAEVDRQQNEAAFQAVAKTIDPARPADSVLASIEKDHPPASALAHELAGRARRHPAVHRRSPDHHDPAVRSGDGERDAAVHAIDDVGVDDTPGPFETAKLAAFYNMTLPDPRAKPSAQEDYMKSWYYAEIANVSVHEVYPGHYIQFLYAKSFPSNVRKVYGASTTAKGGRITANR